MTLVIGRRPGIGDRLDALEEVLDLARGRIDPALVVEVERVAEKAGQRMRFGQTSTVVALAGATGSGKSSLFNALAGGPMSAAGLRRPTTGVAHAAVWSAPDAGPLLDWLDVPRRHMIDSPALDLDGLVLLDLPDVDSVEQQHRLAAERLVERVDLLVGVFDPQKYADAAIHDRYLRPLSGHADVMLVVLNQVDRLPDAARADCVRDLGALAKSDGLEGVTVLATSALTGTGLDALRAELVTRVAAKRASVQRLEADLSALTDSLDTPCSGRSARSVGRAELASLVSALGDAAGADLVAGAVETSYRLRARRATGWPFTRWTSRLRLDPARRLRLRDNPSELVRTSLPGPSAVQRARVDSALRSLADQASDGLPEPWPTAIRKAATGSRAQMPELLDRAVAGTDLGLARRPKWWRAVGLGQLALAGVGVLGLLWLSVLFGVAWLQLPDPPLPHVGPVPVPTLMLAGGLMAGLLLAFISGLLATVGGRRSARLARRRVGERVAQAAADVVVAPVERELAAHGDLGSALARVRGAR
jgi:GTP-binding protein EngB required for normal cell division